MLAQETALQCVCRRQLASVIGPASGVDLTFTAHGAASVSFTRLLVFFCLVVQVRNNNLDKQRELVSAVPASCCPPLWPATS